MRLFIGDRFTTSLKQNQANTMRYGAARFDSSLAKVIAKPTTSYLQAHGINQTNHK